MHGPTFIAMARMAGFGTCTNASCTDPNLTTLVPPTTRDSPRDANGRILCSWCRAPITFPPAEEVDIDRMRRMGQAADRVREFDDAREEA